MEARWGEDRLGRIVVQALGGRGIGARGPGVGAASTPAAPCPSPLAPPASSLQVMTWQQLGFHGDGFAALKPPVVFASSQSRPG